jgi:hypothetical protein
MHSDEHPQAMGSVLAARPASAGQRRRTRISQTKVKCRSQVRSGATSRLMQRKTLTQTPARDAMTKAAGAT